jgi:hypothetical protein
LSPVAPKPTTGAAAKADAKLGGLVTSAGFGNEGTEADDDPKANSEGFSVADVAVVAAAVVAVFTFVAAAAADPKAKSAGGLSVDADSVDGFVAADAADPKLKVGALVAGSDFFSPADDDPNEKIAGMGAEDETVVVVEAVVVAAAAVVEDWPKDKEKAGLGSEEAEVVVEVVVVAALVDV